MKRARVEGADRVVVRRRPARRPCGRPDQPAMKCGSTRPVAMRRSASTKRRSSFTGVPRVARDAEIDVRASSRAKWFSTRTFCEHPRVADELGELRALVRPVQPGRDQHGDAGRAGCPPPIIVLDHRPQEQAVRHRPRDVADEDAGALPAAHEFAIGAAPRSGFASASRTAPRGSASFGSGRLRISVGRARAGSVQLHAGSAVEDAQRVRARGRRRIASRRFRGLLANGRRVEPGPSLAGAGAGGSALLDAGRRGGRIRVMDGTGYTERFLRRTKRAPSSAPASIRCARRQARAVHHPGTARARRRCRSSSVCSGRRLAARSPHRLLLVASARTR